MWDAVWYLFLLVYCMLQYCEKCEIVEWQLRKKEPVHYNSEPIWSEMQAQAFASENDVWVMWHISHIYLCLSWH